jgi:hypothetical protein
MLGKEIYGYLGMAPSFGTQVSSFQSNGSVALRDTLVDFGKGQTIIEVPLRCLAALSLLSLGMKMGKPVMHFSLGVLLIWYPHRTPPPCIRLKICVIR